MSVLLFILGVSLIALGIFVSVVLHEFGHFIPAKLFGARVPQFFFGAGKTLYSFKRGETEFGIKAIPLMGFVRIVGMIPPKPQDPSGTVPASSTSVLGRLVEDAREADHEDVRPGDERRLFYRLPVYQRVIIMLGGPLVNLILGFLLILVLIMGIGTAQPTTTISSVSQCVKTLSAQGDNVQTQQSCSSQDPRTPAVRAGVKAGDKIVAFDGAPVSSWSQLQGKIRSSAGRAVKLEVEREGKVEELLITPMLSERPVLDAFGKPVLEANGKARTESVGFVGVGPTQELTPGSFSQAVSFTGETLKAVGNIVANLPQRLYQVARAAFGQEQRDPNGPISVVGVGRIGGEITAMSDVPVKAKVGSVLGILGGLNLALFVFNLIPLTPLDGGNIAAALWDGARRLWARLRRKPEPHPFDTAKLAPVSAVIFGVFMLMSLLLIYADIVRPVQLG